MSHIAAPKRGFRASHPLALVAASLITLAGCSQIIGLDGYSVASNNGGSSGTVGTAGTVGSAGTGGTVGTAGTGGKGGAVGTAGTTSVSGTGGEAGAPPAITAPLGCDGKTPLTLNDAVIRTCILRVSCDPFNPVRSISQCVTNNTQDAFAGERCNLKSNTCADYQACEHKGIAGDDLCPSNKADTNYCSGNKAVSCGDVGAFSSWVDCIGLGGTACGTYTDANGVEADCKVAETCTGDADYVCSDEATPVYEYQCVAGQAYGFKCGDFAYCDTDSTGAAGCYLSAASCGADSTTCVGNVATVCAGGGQYEYNCGSVGLGCQVGTPDSAGDTNYCLAPGCKPADVNNCAEFCDGTKLNLCYGGTQVAVDCTDYGFTGCLDGLTNGDTLTSYATCVNQ
jgi:hypothetical protein